MHAHSRKYGQSSTHRTANAARQKYLTLHSGLAELYEAERDLMYEADQNRFKKIAAAPPPRRERQYFSKQELGPFKVPTYFNRP